MIAAFSRRGGKPIYELCSFISPILTIYDAWKSRLVSGAIYRASPASTDQSKPAFNSVLKEDYHIRTRSAPVISFIPFGLEFLHLYPVDSCSQLVCEHTSSILFACPRRESFRQSSRLSLHGFPAPMVPIGSFACPPMVRGWQSNPLSILFACPPMVRTLRLW